MADDKDKFQVTLPSNSNEPPSQTGADALRPGGGSPLAPPSPGGWSVFDGKPIWSPAPGPGEPGSSQDLRRDIADAIDQGEHREIPMPESTQAGGQAFWNYIDKAVLSLFEVLALLFALPFGDALFHDKPVTNLYIFYLVIGCLFAIGGPMFPLTRNATWIPKGIAPSISKAARDARIWIAVLLLLFLYGVAPDIYRRATIPGGPNTANEIAEREKAKPLIPPGGVVTGLQATKELNDLRTQVDELRHQNEALRKSDPAPTAGYRNEMGLQQTVQLNNDLADILRRDSPIDIFVTAADDESSKRFKNDWLLLLRNACSRNELKCRFPDLPNPKTNLDAAVPEAQFAGLTIYQDDSSPSLKWGGLDYIAQILRCFIVHTSTNVPRSIERLKSDTNSHVMWFQLGRGSPWVPNADKNEQCAPIHG
jgi:hypothetical protein